MLLLHAQSAAECEPAHSTQLRAVRVFVHFPLLAPDPSDGNRVDDIDDARLGINVAIVERMVFRTTKKHEFFSGFDSVVEAQAILHNVHSCNASFDALNAVSHFRHRGSAW